MEIMTNHRQQAGFGMPVRPWMSTSLSMRFDGIANGAAAGSKRVCVEGTVVSGSGEANYGRPTSQLSDIVFATGAFPGNSAWSPPI
jgi:hypothetical protein